jgi:Raf kinase inhibitor-like YbhB/YbcL family protein
VRKTAIAAIVLLGLASPATAMALKSSDLAEGAKVSMDQVYMRCGGRNISPALVWSGAPQATKSFALTLIDIDVKPAQWSHWIVVGLSPQTTALARGAALPSGARALVSDFGDAAYGGPCPPAGSGVHHYRFTIWALPSAQVSPPANAHADALTAWLARGALASATLTGYFQR